MTAQAITVVPPRARRLPNLGVRLLGLMALDALVSVWVWLLFGDGYWQLAAMVILITAGINYVVLKADAFPLRWISPGLAFMLLLSVYPIIYTIYISFTNFGTGHLLPKPQAIQVLEQRQFLPDTGKTYQYTLFRAGENNFALWLQPESGPGFLALPQGVSAAPQVGALDAKGVPTSIAGYAQLTRPQVVQALSALQDTTFAGNGKSAQLTSRLGVAAELEPRYQFDAGADAMLDRKTNTRYVADNRNGFFTSQTGETIVPGYQVNVGVRNFQRFFADPSFRGPLFLVFIWTFMFALVSVFLAFALGLLIAIAFGRDMPGAKIIKGLLIIPFAVPNVITILVWRGMLNPLDGVISTTLARIFNQPAGWPPVFADALWVKVALIVINVWLAYPYFMLVSSGALQAIPSDMYEAASIFGANGWQQFRYLTLPMLLIAVGPLLIGSFIANFNSLNVVYLFNQGGPPMVGTSTPAGHSDILISYVYRLAFAGGGGQDFGYASAISMVIFIILAVITLFQFRTMRTLEKVGENV